jgi:hypothetical protein
MNVKDMLGPDGGGARTKTDNDMLKKINQRNL